jgi:hypothetical protein
MKNPRAGARKILQFTIDYLLLTIGEEIASPSTALRAKGYFRSE